MLGVRTMARMVRHTNFGVIVILLYSLNLCEGHTRLCHPSLSNLATFLFCQYGFAAFRVFLSLSGASTANEHHRASIQRSRIAPLAPLHIGESRDERYQEQIRSQVVRPRGKRIDGHKKDR